MSDERTDSPQVLDADAEQRTLAERARALARVRQERDLDTAMLAVFERKGIRYAIDQRYVFEVARAPCPTALPKSDPHWLGVTSLHGELLAVADLALLIGNGEAARAADDEGTLLLVLGTESRELALEIDAVQEPVNARTELLRPPHADTASLIEGVTEDGLRVVRGDWLLADPRLFVQSSSNDS